MRGCVRFSTACCVVALVLASGAAVACADDESGRVTLQCDYPYAGSISSPTQTDSHEFSASDGERVKVTLDAVAPSGVSFSTEWRVIKNDGTSYEGWTTSPSRDMGPLVVSASPYRIEVQDHDHDDTGTYRIHLQRLTAVTACENNWAVPGTPTAGSIDPVFDTDLVGFLPEDGGTVHITIEEVFPSGAQFQAAWRVIRNDGTSYTSLTTNPSVDVGPLAMSESPYRIEVQDYNHDDTGTYSISMTGITGVGTDDLPSTGFLGCRAVTPNPVDRSTVVRFALQASGHTKLQVFNPAGRFVATLLDEPLGTGIHEVRWTPGPIANGIYFCHLEVGGRSFFTRLVLVR